MLSAVKEGKEMRKSLRSITSQGRLARVQKNIKKDVFS